MVGPACGQRPDRRASGRAGHQGAGQGSGSGGAHGGVVGEHLDQQPHGAQRAAATDEARKRGVHGDERLEHQVVAGAQMRALVAEDRHDLGVANAVSVPSLTTTRLRTPGRQ